MGLFSALLSGATMAQDQAPDPEGFEGAPFQAFLESDYAERIRREALQRSMVLHEPACVEVPMFEVTETWPVEPIVMGEGDIAPTEGMWRERISRTACEETATENMVHTFTGEGQRSFLLIRGDTEANLETQLRLINDARDAAAADDNALGCDIIRFTETQVLNRYGNDRWQERWRADACGNDVDLEILFESGPELATTYTISAAR